MSRFQPSSRRAPHGPETLQRSEKMKERRPHYPASSTMGPGSVSLITPLQTCHNGLAPSFC